MHKINIIFRWILLSSFFLMDRLKKELHETLDRFWIKYTKLYNKNDHFYINEFIWSSKDIRDGNSHLWHQKYSLSYTKVLGFVYFRVTSKIPVNDLRSVHGVMLKQSNQGRYQLLSVTFLRSRVLCILLLVLKNREL